jgi:nitroreductase
MAKTLLELSKGRRSVRKYTDENISLDDILYSLKVASLAPSGANEQPWRFIIVDDDNIKKRIRIACERGERQLYANVKGEFKKWLLGHGLSHEKPFLERAPYLVVVLMNKSAKYAKESVWIAIGQMLLALEEKNLRTLVYTPSNTDLPFHELEAPAGFMLEAIIPVGHSDDESPRTSRRELSETIFMNMWGNPFLDLHAPESTRAHVFVS